MRLTASAFALLLAAAAVTGAAAAQAQEIDWKPDLKSGLEEVQKSGKAIFVADRERFPDLKDIYAIEKRTDDSASMWKAKGIKPIEFADYPNIYATLAEWARFAMQPTEYGHVLVRSILSGPGQLPGGGA